MKKTMIEGDYILDILHERTSRHGITYRVAMLPDAPNMAFLFDNNNASGKWYLLRLGDPEILTNTVNRICSR